jgi:DNA-directed RNA polymerase subunit RPC12/RpoP
MTETETLNCVECGEEYGVSRWLALKGDALRRVRCKSCADDLPPPIRTVANLHKSNSILITNRADLIGINQKGGLVK